MSKTELLEECFKLSPDDRAEILEALWAMEDSLHAGPTPEEAALLDAAMEDYKNDGDRGRPFEQVFAELRTKP